MEIAGRKIWQQFAGNKDRNYVALCLKWSVILNGPGDYGRWPKCGETLRLDGQSEKKITDLRRFCGVMKYNDLEVMKDNHLVVLKLGTNEVYAVGEIVGDYKYNEEFNDVDGWDIAHVCRVFWLWECEENNPKKFETYSLKRGDTTQLLSDSKVDVSRWLEELDVKSVEESEPLIELPGSGEDNYLDEIPDFLSKKASLPDRFRI